MQNRPAPIKGKGDKIAPFLHEKREYSRTKIAMVDDGFFICKEEQSFGAIGR